MSIYDKAQEKLIESITKQSRVVGNRKKLGPMVPIQLFQALRIVGMGTALEETVGSGARALVYKSGQDLGDIIAQTLIPEAENDLEKYARLIRKICLDLRIGEVSVEKVDLNSGLLVIRVDECVSCAGLQGAEVPICQFETGMVGGLVRTFMKARVKAVETRCYAIGDDTCGVDVHVLGSL